MLLIWTQREKRKILLRRRSKSVGFSFCPSYPQSASSGEIKFSSGGRAIYLKGNMANRFTDTEKWKDAWFCDLSDKDKLFWLYILDNCDHCGIWKINWSLVKYHIKDYVFNNEVFGDRIELLDQENMFVKKFVLFQQKVNSLEDLNPSNKCHLSIIKRLNIKTSPLEAPSEGLTRGYSNSKVIVKVNKEKVRYDPKVCELISKTAKKLKVEGKLQ